MRKNDAETLWRTIIEYANSKFELGGEGNSGEFHSDSEFNFLTKNSHKALKTLVRVFHTTTKWKPIYIEGKSDTDYDGHWILVKCDIS